MYSVTKSSRCRTNQQRPWLPDLRQAAASQHFIFTHELFNSEKVPVHVFGDFGPSGVDDAVQDRPFGARRPGFVASRLHTNCLQSIDIWTSVNHRPWVGSGVRHQLGVDRR